MSIWVCPKKLFFTLSVAFLIIAAGVVEKGVYVGNRAACSCANNKYAKKLAASNRP